MPSLFSKIRHRKTGSTSSVGSNSSANTPASPSTPSRATNTNAPSNLQPYSSPTSGRDETGHSAPFADESDRPGLPTTTSNVDNPVPVPSGRTSSTSQGTSYVDPNSAVKPLPAVPEVQTPGGGRGELNEFPVPPQDNNVGSSGRPRRLSEVSGGPPVPPRSPVRSSISIDRNDATSPPPLPHVTSTTRDHLSPTDRPGMFVSASRPQQQSENLAGEFPHAGSVGKPAGPRDARTARTGLATGPSSMSLQESAQAAEAYLSRSRRSSHSSYSDQDDAQRNGRRAHHRGYNSNQIRSAQDGSNSLSDDLRSTYNGDRDPQEHISDHLARFAQRSHPKAVSDRIDREYGDFTAPPGTHPELEAQRSQFVSQLADGAAARQGAVSKLTADGEKAFHAAGMGGLIGQQNTVDVHTKWLKPVVQEHIRRTEHTEYMTIIDREIHKYHIYPKIQPIYDPDPIRLETRHRIFSPADGKWHEVIGDAAAIEILGEEAFRSGKKEVREHRELALPELDGSEEMSRKLKLLSLSGNGQTAGAGLGHAHGGVWEREYPLGQQGGAWNEIARLGGGNQQNTASNGQATQGSSVGRNRDSVGVAL